MEGSSPLCVRATPRLRCVPRRTNLFQEVVATVYTNLAGNADKTESAMLLNRLTGFKREVDIVLRTQTAGHETVIAIEAASGGRAATVEWVEQMIGKHKNLPTDKVVLVAEAGFSKQAHSLAQAEKMIPMTSEELSPDTATGVMQALSSLWPKTVTFKPASARLWVRRPDGRMVTFTVTGNLTMVLDDDTEAELVDVIRDTIEHNVPSIVDQIRLADIAKNTESEFTIHAGGPVTVDVDGEPHGLFARWAKESEPELWRIEKIAVDGSARVHVDRIDLSHGRLGDVRYAYGQGSIAGTSSLVVVTEDDKGGRLSVRGDPEG
jgi:hypothetical protein